MNKMNFRIAMYLTFFHKKKWIWTICVYLLIILLPSLMNLIPNHPGFMVPIGDIRMYTISAVTIGLFLGFLNNLS